MYSLQALVIINNSISAHLTHRLLELDGVPLDRVGVIMIRDIEANWTKHCAKVIRYGGRPTQSILGQRQFLPFFREGAKLVKEACASSELREFYVVNNDNLLTNPLFRWAERNPRRHLRLTVVAEGIMNYQDIDVRDRAAWRWRIKPMMAAMLGLEYRIPAGHLSGAFEAATTRAVSFTQQGFKAPVDKISILPFPRSPITRAPDAETCLIVHTGLWQWMTTETYEPFAKAFAAWVSAQGFKRILTKPHPRIATGVIENLLPPHEVLHDTRSAEEMAAEIPAATVVGTCCTALVTLKLIRPDLRCVDFGADFYCMHAYHDDLGVVELFSGAGVEIVGSGLPLTNRTTT